MRTHCPAEVPVAMWVAVCGMILGASDSSLAQGILETLRREVRTERDRDSHQRDRRRVRERDVRESDDDTRDFLGGMALRGLTLPFWGPPVVLEDNYRDYGEFFSYPYKRGATGMMVVDPAHHALTKVWHIRTRGEYLQSFSGLSSVGGQVLVDTLPRLGLDSEFYHRQENLPAGRRDSLWTGDLNVLFRFAQSPLVQMRTGLGVNWLSDAVDRDYGFNFTYGGDLMFRDPWILSAEIDAGTLGSATLLHGRLTVGVQRRHVEVYTGYDYFRVGHMTIDGCLAGVRLWF